MAAGLTQLVHSVTVQCKYNKQLHLIQDQPAPGKASLYRSCHIYVLLMTAVSICT